MKVYLVGGAVRDLVMSLPVKDKDYVVVGSTVEEMLSLGFQQVGADFPVFLHPHTNEEYALARVERKSGKGYLGFTVDSNPNITLEDNLLRRDLTINSMAIEVKGLFDSSFKDGNIIDPYKGLKDVDNKVLRHTSEAFKEDPVRVLRIARFAARYDFEIAEETKQIILDIKKDGELNHLVSERLWSELTKVFKENTYYKFFNILSDLDVLKNLFPEVYDQRYLLIPLSINNLSEKYQFCLLATIFYTYENKFISFCERLKVPKEYEKLGHFVLSHFDNLVDYVGLDPFSRFTLYEKSGLLKQSNLMFDALEFIHYYKMINDKNELLEIQAILKEINADSVSPDLKGNEIGAAIRQKRIDKLYQLD